MVAVVLVLLTTSLDLSGEARGQVVDEGVKLVESIYYPMLFRKRWNGNGGV